MKDLFDFKKWDMGTWSGVIIVFFIIYISIVSVISMTNAHELDMAKVNCQKTTEEIK